tara:strand:+ start:568 stop:858 length:291 start_codon:yes stop_codon:yes gene_type:complete
MDKEKALKIVSETVREVLNQNEVEFDLTKDTPIVGINSPIDSMGLIQVCMALEEKAEAFGFEFDWTNEAAMSKSQGIFRSVDALSNEILSQYNNKK